MKYQIGIGIGRSSCKVIIRYENLVSGTDDRLAALHCTRMLMEFLVRTTGDPTMTGGENSERSLLI